VEADRDGDIRDPVDRGYDDALAYHPI
jgi:hypothetical protein